MPAMLGAVVMMLDVSECGRGNRRSFITTTVRDESQVTPLRERDKGAPGRVRTGDQRPSILCHCQHGQDIPTLRHSSRLRAGRSTDIRIECSAVYTLRCLYMARITAKGAF